MRVVPLLGVWTLNVALTNTEYFTCKCESGYGAKNDDKWYS